MQWTQIIAASDYPPIGDQNHVLVYANWNNVFFNLYYAHYKGDQVWCIYDPCTREWKDLPKELNITHWTKDINYPIRKNYIDVHEVIEKPPLIVC